MYDKYLEIQLHWSVVIPSMPRFAKASAKAAVVPAAGPAPRSIADLVSQDPPAITAVDVIGRVCYVFGSQGRYPQCKFALRAATTASGTAGTSGETWPIAILVKCNDLRGGCRCSMTWSPCMGSVEILARTTSPFSFDYINLIHISLPKWCWSSQYISIGGFESCDSSVLYCNPVIMP